VAEPEAQRDTKERILDAAEKSFAEEGFGASYRTITSGAGVNLAAVNYHFGSKEALIGAVFARRLGPLNAERLRLLDEQEASGPTLERIVEAFAGPALRMSHNPQGAVFMRLFGYTLSQRSDTILRMFHDQFREVVDRFSAALGRALPDLPREEIFWRLLFMVGAMAHTMALSDKLPVISGGICDATDVEGTIGRLVAFVSAGLRAPVATPAPGGNA